MKMTKREVGPVIVLDAQGDFCLLEVGRAREHFKEILESGDQKQVVLNMTDVPKIDSSGIGALVDFQSKLKKAGGKFAIFNLNKHIHDIMELTNIITFFEVCDGEDAAIGSVS